MDLYSATSVIFRMCRFSGRRKLLSKKPAGKEAIRLNRFLLQDPADPNWLNYPGRVFYFLRVELFAFFYSRTIRTEKLCTYWTSGAGIV